MMNHTALDEVTNKDNPDFEWAVVPISQVKTLRKPTLKWEWLRKTSGSLKINEALFLALPDDHNIRKFATNVRLLLNSVWRETNQFRWSIRTAERLDGVYVIKVKEYKYNDDLPDNPPKLKRKHIKTGVRGTTI